MPWGYCIVRQCVIIVGKCNTSESHHAVIVVDVAMEAGEPGRAEARVTRLSGLTYATIGARIGGARAGCRLAALAPPAFETAVCAKCDFSYTPDARCMSSMPAEDWTGRMSDTDENLRTHEATRLASCLASSPHGSH
jgi:hypothetical protein